MPDVSLFPIYHTAPGSLAPSAAQTAAWQVGIDQSLGLAVRPVETSGGFMGWLVANQQTVMIGAAALTALLLLGGRRR